MQHSKDILISGASVAGPALAYWLHRHGFNPTVVERAPAPRPGGQAVDLRGAARDVAGRMGILDQVRAAHVGTRGMAYVDADGRRLAGMPADLLGDSGGAVAELEILRGDLVRILYQATHDQVEYRFDDAIAELAQGEDGLKVGFQRGPSRRFDLVIGADGLHSGVRGLAFGEEPAFVRHLGAYVSSFSVASHLDLDGWELLHSAPGRTAGIYPVRRGTEARAVLFFASPPLAYDRHDLDQQRHLLADAFAGVGWEIPRLLEAMWQAPDFYFDAVGQVHMDRWSSGRVALVGDAAYGPSPMAGVGTSLALVGAYVLAGELAAADGDHQRAFASYERALRDYVGKGQRLAKGNAIGLIPRSHRQIRMRNRFIRMLPYLPWRGLVAGGVHKAANAITLEDYQRPG
jgi:2-polyprenyl-6-methoxyphenol hydroxylase-like FAD-dependent oxidoreductase